MTSLATIAIGGGMGVGNGVKVGMCVRVGVSIGATVADGCGNGIFVPDIVGILHRCIIIFL